MGILDEPEAVPDFIPDDDAYWWMAIDIPNRNLVSDVFGMHDACKPTRIPIEAFEPFENRWDKLP